ncbi:hypothetical protein EAE96_002503 [Botrytis aclada]|nr:hypothetical protein EAE96_002503 [Botrytis aclada]
MLFRLQFSSHYFLEPPKSERAAVCIVFSALDQHGINSTGWDRMNQRAIIWWSDLWRYLFELNMLLRDMMGGNQRKMDT